MRNLDQSVARSDASSVFTEWLQEHGGILMKVGRAFALNHEDQRDLRQQMQLQIWRSLESYSGQAKVSTWIYRVCLNTALSWQRSEQRRRFFFAKATEADLFPNEKATPEDPRLAILYGAIQRLAPADRALVLLQLEERSYRDIAEISGLTESNVGVRLQRSRKKLAAYLPKEASV
ncbi:MAG: RNA polymerase sigma factor [Spartobacteria bacterium]